MTRADRLSLMLADYPHCADCISITIRQVQAGLTSDNSLFLPDASPHEGVFLRPRLHGGQRLWDVYRWAKALAKVVPVTGGFSDREVDRALRSDILPGCEAAEPGCYTRPFDRQLSLPG